MNKLEKIQKTFGIFQILARIAKIFCIVGASICVAAALCTIIWHNGGQVLSLFGEPLTINATGEKLREKCAFLLSKTVIYSAEAILLSFGLRYIKLELSEGKPFTENGAELEERAVK